MIAKEDAAMAIIPRNMIATLSVALPTTVAAWAAPTCIAPPLKLDGIHSKAIAINANGQVTG